MDDRLRAGVGLFNAGEFFEAHEVWEALWLESVGADRLVLQGLIQIAAGYHKYEIGVPAGALKLLTTGLQKLGAYGDEACGLVIGKVRAAVAADIERLRAAGSPCPPRLMFVAPRSEEGAGAPSSKLQQS
ncbi:MAG TPA: DUF309 domain-containing protein [Candidatus Binatia bacterium]|nr:DUF309 domain-containing protein [Candidatus Binatia bacterium]